MSMEKGAPKATQEQIVDELSSECGFIEFTYHPSVICPLPQMLKFGLERVVHAKNLDLEDDQIKELLESAIYPEFN